MAEEFFQEKQAGAVLKHGILKRYLPVFVSKTGVRAPHRRVVFIDGYAGPGTYDDGGEGSPALAVATARSLEKHRNVHGVFVEADKAIAAKLKAMLDAEGGPMQATVLVGEVAAKLDAALTVAGEDAPLFAFLDPFGNIHLTMDQVVSVLARTKGPGRAPTELMISFMYQAVRRVMGQLDGKGTSPKWLKARDTMVATMDARMGGDWWREAWRQSANLDPEMRCRVLAAGYLKELTNRISGSWGYYRVPVRQRYGKAVTYELLYVTQYPDEGLWYFNEAASNAYEEYRGFCLQGQQELEGPNAFRKRLEEAAYQNARRLLEENGGFRVRSKMAELTVADEGLPRARHIRAAIKRLHREGKTTCDGKGEVRNMWVCKAT